MFRSKPFLFIIGDRKSEYHLQAGIIAKQSKALNVLVHGTMTEAVEGKATLMDITEDTFERFCQFAYTTTLLRNIKQSRSCLLMIRSSISKHHLNQRQIQRYPISPNLKLSGDSEHNHPRNPRNRPNCSFCGKHSKISRLGRKRFTKG